MNITYNKPERKELKFDEIPVGSLFRFAKYGGFDSYNKNIYLKTTNIHGFQAINIFSFEGAFDINNSYTKNNIPLATFEIVEGNLNISI